MARDLKVYVKHNHHMFSILSKPTLITAYQINQVTMYHRSSYSELTCIDLIKCHIK